MMEDKDRLSRFRKGGMTKKREIFSCYLVRICLFLDLPPKGKRVFSFYSLVVQHARWCLEVHSYEKKTESFSGSKKKLLTLQIIYFFLSRSSMGFLIEAGAHCLIHFPKTTFKLRLILGKE